MMLTMAAWLAVGAIGPQSVPDPCATLAGALKDRACVAAGPAGAAIAPDAARARRLAELAGAADQAFRERYGVAPAPYVVFDAGTPPEVSRDRAAFQRADFPVVLPWFSGQAWIAQQRRTASNGIRAQMAGFGAGEEQIANAVVQVTAQIDARNTPEALEAREVSGVSGDLTRQWFSRAYWPSAERGPTGAVVSGGGPSWLIEAAVALSEPAAAAEVRRTLFRDMLAGEGAGPLAAVSADDLLDLRALMATTPETAGRAGGGDQIRMIRNGEGPDLSRLTFGPRVRAFVDYLTTRGGDARAIRRLAEAQARGETFEAWLADEGAAHGLPLTMDALAADWRAWATQSPGPA